LKVTIKIPKSGNKISIEYIFRNVLLICKCSIINKEFPRTMIFFPMSSNYEKGIND
jgi:hypothetical protein